MEMNPNEIITRYRQAKDPDAQRSILADLNCCTVREIDEILLNAGIRPKPRRPNKINDAKARDVYSTGASDASIGKACGVSITTARRWRTENGLPANFKPGGMRKTIFGSLSVVSLFLAVGSVGALERFAISTQQGAIQIFGFLAAFTVLAWLSGAFPEKKKGEIK